MPVVIDWSGWEVSKTEPILTDGNLALDEFEPLPDEGEAAHVSPVGGGTSTTTTEPVEEKEPGLLDKERKNGIEKPFPLKARRFKRMDKRTLPAVVSAFKESCRRCGFSYHVGQDEQGRPRVVLSGAQGGIALAGLSVKLEQTPQLEAMLLLELAQKDAAIQELLEERAAIRAADGLPDDDMSVALLTIGAEERGKRGAAVDVVMAIVDEFSD